VASGAPDGVLDALVPLANALSLVQDDLGVWLCGNHLSCEDGRGCIGDGNGMTEQGIEISCCDVVLAVRRAEPPVSKRKPEGRRVST
jgi:hypothetical protein